VKRDAPAETSASDETYLTARQAAAYLHLNEKTLYALVADGAVPATRVTGKWLFPRRLLDEWLIDSAHGGALMDRLLIGGSDDPLLAAAATQLAAEMRADALVALSPTGTRLGLDLLAKRRINVCGIHWGTAEGSAATHAQLVREYPASADWTIVRMALREQGVLLARGHAGVPDLPALIARNARWAVRQDGAGSQRFLRTALLENGLPYEAIGVQSVAYSERRAAALVAQGGADCAPGVRSAAAEFGLAFLPLGWEAFDLVVPRPVFFRTLFQRLLESLRGETLRGIAADLRGYNLQPLGQVVPLD
jgi:putative molybdopterin biosynthesis protein